MPGFVGGNNSSLKKSVTCPVWVVQKVAGVDCFNMLGLEVCWRNLTLLSQSDGELGKLGGFGVGGDGFLGCFWAKGLFSGF